MPKCLCDEKTIPAKRRGEVRSKQGKLVHVFHLDCPLHGMQLVAETDLVAVRRAAWMTPAEAGVMLKKKTNVRILSQARDDGRWQFEWTEWERAEEVDADA